MSQPKKWGFTELVQDSDEPEQLIAYAMYKADKDDLAIQCRARLLPEADIVVELTSFHDSIAYSERRLQDYRDKAKRAVDQLVSSVSERLAAAYDQTISTMTDEHQIDLQEKWKKWGEDAALYSAHLTKPVWYTRFGKGILSWLGGGVSGLLATAISTLLIVGAVSLFTPSVRDTARDSLKGVVDT
ncbi:hypothetical protein DRV48_16140, partial [Salmonella enterica subsp. enterica serovar Rissen]|nr:hypothetical protein [Salmonella enterica subsp. enterica serovar Rissen]EBX3955749.1 hypothetical protein [Salmonella enterica subsp. enterica serovar Rissen]EBX9747411.1 hypothetical protein [Salmonella enterica subsp. enterica serovar Rissen]